MCACVYICIYVFMYVRAYVCVCFFWHEHTVRLSVCVKEKSTLIEE